MQSLEQNWNITASKTIKYLTLHWNANKHLFCSYLIISSVLDSIIFLIYILFQFVFAADKISNKSNNSQLYDNLFECKVWDSPLFLRVDIV